MSDEVHHEVSALALVFAAVVGTCIHHKAVAGSLIVTPRNQVARTGDDVLLKCRTNESSLTVWWHFNAHSDHAVTADLVSKGDQINFKFTARCAVIDGSDLLIRSVQSIDAGMYVCSEEGRRAHAAELVISHGTDDVSEADCSYSHNIIGSSMMTASTRCVRVSTYGPMSTRSPSVQQETPASVAGHRRTVQSTMTCVLRNMNPSQSFLDTVCRKATCATNQPEFYQTCQLTTELSLQSSTSKSSGPVQSTTPVVALQQVLPIGAHQNEVGVNVILIGVFSVIAVCLVVMAIVVIVRFTAHARTSTASHQDHQPSVFFVQMPPKNDHSNRRSKQRDRSMNVAVPQVYRSIDTQQQHQMLAVSHSSRSSTENSYSDISHASLQQQQGPADSEHNIQSYESLDQLTLEAEVVIQQQPTVYDELNLQPDS